MTLKSLSDNLVGLVQSITPGVVHVKIHGSRGDSTGSGLVIRNEGYILTNHHVIDKADSIDIEGLDGDVWSATVRGEDPLTDMAVVKIDHTFKIVPPFGDSTKVQVGELVIAIGNPFGFQLSTTLGIVSGINRSMPNRVGRTISNIIQTDAAINPGNSGGPLVTMEGTVVGIMTASILGTQGMSFAVASNIVAKVVDVLITKGEVIRGFLGVQGTTTRVDSNITDGLGLPTSEALNITGILAEGPAGKILEYDDILLELDGTQVTSGESLIQILTPDIVGKEVELVVLRKGEIVRVRATPSQY